MEGRHEVSDLPTVAFKKRAVKSKSTARKRAATPPQNASAEFEFSSSEDEDGRQVKRRRKVVGVTATSTTRELRATDEIQASTTAVLSTIANDATKSSNWFDDATGHVGSTRAQPHVQDKPDGTPIAIQAARVKNPSTQVGPVKSSTNVRTITFTDMAPDVCKDYKQTGFCGFGDSCKFLHAREDYKQGWELDRDWEIGTKGKRIQSKTVASANRSSKTGDEDEDDDTFLESIPFACIICKTSYVNPIVTKCGHYFCEACALQRYRKTPSCAACGTGTGGVFNVARKLNTLLAKKKARRKNRKQKASDIADRGSESSGGGDESSEDNSNNSLGCTD